MKIGILTQPLHCNYGGLLQAWALQMVLTELGHEVVIINREFENQNCHRSSVLEFLSWVKNELYIALGKRKRYIPVSERIKATAEQFVNSFKNQRYSSLSPALYSDRDFRNYISDSHFDAFVVGSDQVWRPMYSPRLMTYFLDFVKDDSQVKKIAYAASFGVDYWELSSSQTKEAAHLASHFDLITLREDSGVKLVNEFLHCNAYQVLDPTMLLDRDDYMSLVYNPTSPLKDSEGQIFCYVLDKVDDMQVAIDTCSSRTGMRPYYCNSEIPLWRMERYDQIEKCIIPSIEQWLKSFIDAEIVITDSFHGAVFSIIFNKPFWIVVNKKRGSARFHSLLRLFCLENRIVSNPFNTDWTVPIDWYFVNTHRSSLRTYSLALLSKALE